MTHEDVLILYYGIPQDLRPDPMWMLARTKANAEESAALLLALYEALELEPPEVVDE